MLQDLENILFAGVCMHFSARKFTGLGSSEGSKEKTSKEVPVLGNYNAKSTVGLDSVTQSPSVLGFRLTY